MRGGHSASPCKTVVLEFSCYSGLSTCSNPAPFTNWKAPTKALPVNLQLEDFQVPGFLRKWIYIKESVHPYSHPFFYLLQEFFLGGKTLLCNHPHPQKCMGGDSYFSHVGPDFLSLQSPPWCLAMVWGLELFPYLLPCCVLVCPWH